MFHYGNCKNEIETLKCLRQHDSDTLQKYKESISGLVNQVQEGKALYDYQVGVLEREIERLKNGVTYDDTAMEQLRKGNIYLMEEMTLKCKQLEELEKENKALKEEVELRGKRLDQALNDLGSRKCVTDSYEEQIKDLQKQLAVYSERTKQAAIELDEMEASIPKWSISTKAPKSSRRQKRGN